MFGRSLSQVLFLRASLLICSSSSSRQYMLVSALQPPLAPSSLSSSFSSSTTSIANAAANTADSAYSSLAKKVRFGDIIPESVLETEVELPDLPDGVPFPDITSLPRSLADIQAWRDQAAVDYPLFVRDLIRYAISTIEEVKDIEELREVKQKQAELLQDYNKAISLPFKKFSSLLDESPLPESIKNGEWVDNAKVYNNEVLVPGYKQILNTLFGAQTYADAKASNEEAIVKYNSALTKAYNLLRNAYPEEAIAQQKVNNEQIVKGYNSFITQINRGLVKPAIEGSREAIAQQKVNNQDIVKGYNTFVTQINQGLVKPAIEGGQSAVENLKAANEVIAPSYKQFATVVSTNLFEKVLVPVGKQSNVLIEATKTANKDLVVPAYTNLVTKVYSLGVAPVLSSVSKASSPVLTQALEQTKAAQADAVISYNDWITQTYIQVGDAVGPYVNSILDTPAASNLKDVLGSVLQNLY